MRICAIVPAYNEQEHVGEVVVGIRKYLADVVMIDDGSADETARLAAEAGAKVLRHKRNRGKGAALKTAFDWAERNGFDAVIVLDADGQHDWNEIPKFIQTADREGAEIVVGDRMGHIENMPWLRKVTNQFTSWVISRMIGQQVHDTQCGYRLMRMETIGALKLKTHKYDTESEMLLLAGKRGYRIANVPIKTIYSGQKSFINPVTETLRFFRLVFRYLFVKKGLGRTKNV